MSKEKLKNKGITLIALIITIIVMLILTGVTLSITLGDNGLVNKAKEATTQTQVGMDRELLLSAVVGAMGNDGKVNLSAIVLPEGFTGSNGTYTSKNGNSFTVSENGEVLYTSSGNTGDNIIDNGGEAEIVDLDGIYYFDGMPIVEIIDNSKMYYGGEIGYNITIDYANRKIEATIADEYKDYIDEFFYGTYMTATYDVYLENNEITNIVLVFGMEYDEVAGAIVWQNTNGFETGLKLDGMYINESGTERITFYSETGESMREQYFNGAWNDFSSDEYGNYYETFNGMAMVMYFGSIHYISEDYNTFTTAEGEVYTKVVN